MTHSIFMTGATGFLGTQIARRLLENPGIELFALVRAPDDTAALERLRREWWDFADLIPAIGGRVRVISGDLTLPGFGIDLQTWEMLIYRITHIVHAAADIRLFAPLDALRQVNLTGTRNVLDFARSVQAAQGLQRLEHISTAYVAGGRRGQIREEDLSAADGFLSPYERSKYEAELLVRAAAVEFPITILRPGMIVGDSHSGAIKTFNTLYYPLRLYLTGRIAVSPASPHARVNLVPVDYVAQSAASLLLDPRAVGLTFHLTPPAEDSPTQTQLADFARSWARREMGLALPRARFFFLPASKISSALFEKFLGPEFAALAQLLPYFQSQPVFQRENSDALLGPYPHRWQDLLSPMLAYAVRYNFWERSSRTVHEQIMRRLQSRTRPVVYHDLVDGLVHTRSSAQMRAEILALVRAFRSMGLSSGDRVAVVGHNHTRYFNLFVACGLAGIVIVPLYATSPPEEIEVLLADCQPKLFFVGAPAVLRRLDEIRFEPPVISFPPSRGAGEPVPRPARVALSWDEFIARGSATGGFKISPLPLDAPAAIFYTSGTTGQPKGVLYNHTQLRWLAETLASMYPWRERNRKGAYLSYLPMNHVVEGILATYSPYYVPAALDIYFLTEFSLLQQALLTARPTIFFSVPRFFEKVRAAFEENKLAQLYLRTRTHSNPGFLRGILRRGLLRKTGLDRCRQMIVGSAPSAPELLTFFAELGVEIHNAFGLTEAPLVSMNRLGRNRSDTLGELLPETACQIQSDGEILIKGPQVSSGYLENGIVQPFDNGWLSTGDLGTVDTGGHLTIFGRKKDLIITAYGNKIFPAPIEAGLRTIPGVAEALLLGESRSYCVALIWLEPGFQSGLIPAEIRTGVSRVNAHLNHAEQIKRWAILPDQLTVSNGCLTGSMKLKREVLSARFSQIIEALYRGDAPPADVCFGHLDRSGENPG